MKWIFNNFTVCLSLIVSLIMLTSFGCGSKDSPTGGKQDLEKLTVLASLPLEFSEISEQKVEITFSKDLDKSTFIKGFYIYPPIVNKKITIDGNVATIKFLEELQNHTNYYLILTNRIKDIRGNSLDQNQTLIYKYGNLQTNRITGSVLYENPTDAGMPVLVHLLSEDSLWVLSKSITGSSFAIEALNPLNYQLKAYIDKNQNGRYDFKQEPYFEANIDNIPLQTLNLMMAYADTVKPAIRMVRGNNSRDYEIYFNKSLKSYSGVRLESVSSSESIPIFAENHSSDKITLLTAQTDTTRIRFIVTDLEDFKSNKNVRSIFVSSGSDVIDNTPPRILNTIPRNGATVNTLLPKLEIHFSEIITSSNFKADLVEVDTKTSIPFSLIKSNHSIYIIQPDKQLSNYKTHVLTIEAETRDLAGNKLDSDYKFVFLPISRN